MGRSQGLAGKRPCVPWRQCLAGAQVPGSLGFYALEALPVAFSAQGWQRCVLRSPPSDAVFPLVGAVAQCRNRLAVCNGIPGRSSRGASSIACGGRRWRGYQGPYPLGGLGPQYVTFRGGASTPSRVPPPGLARGSVGPPPPHCTQSRLGGGGGFVRTARSRRLFHATPTSFRRLPGTPRSQGRGGGASLLSTPVTVPGLRKGGGSTGVALEGQGPISPSEPTSGPQRPVLSSRVAVGREGIRGSGWLHARCSRRGGGPLEWWAVPCVHRRARLARRWRWVL